MKPTISIPREALAELLRASGSPLTPEQYVASLPEVTAYKKYPSRVRAAAWSKNILVVVAVLAVVCLPFGFDLEDVIIVIGLATVTFYEFRVHRYFSEDNPGAPSLGFRNQAAFAAAILIYGLYHALVPTQVEIPSEYREMMDPNTTGMIQAFERVFYLFIGAVGGVSQFALAWYYRSAQVGPTV
jgi:hypothetical protein